MTQELFSLIFKILSLASQILFFIQYYVNWSIRRVYVPWLLRFNTNKLIDQLANIQRKPQEVTVVVQVKANTNKQVSKVVQKLCKFIVFIKEGIRPGQINCYIATEQLSKALQHTVQEIVGESSLNQLSSVYFSGQVDYAQSISVDKTNTTPFVIAYCSYPSLSSVHAKWLVGAQFSLRSSIERTSQYELLQDFRQYASSEQRKGK